MSNWPEPSYLDYQQWADEMSDKAEEGTEVDFEFPEADISNPPEWVEE